MPVYFAVRFWDALKTRRTSDMEAQSGHWSTINWTSPRKEALVG